MAPPRLEVIEGGGSEPTWLQRILRSSGGEAPPTSDGRRVGSASSTLPIWLGGAAIAAGGFAVVTGAVTIP